MKARQLAGRSAAVIAVGALCLAAGGIGIAAATNGGSLVLGGSNAETRTTMLKNTGGIPLSLLAKKGAAPLAVNSKKLVKNLNASELGGLTAAQLKTTGSAAQMLTTFNSSTPNQVILPELASSTPPFVWNPVMIVSTAKLAAGSYLVTATATGGEAACWVGTAAGPSAAHQLGLAQEGSSAVTQVVKVSKGQRINEYCSDISTSQTGTIVGAGITALRVSSVSVGKTGT
jgi:hypothetical protein